MCAALYLSVGGFSTLCRVLHNTRRRLKIAHYGADDIYLALTDGDKGGAAWFIKLRRQTVLAVKHGTQIAVKVCKPDDMEELTEDERERLQALLRESGSRG